MKITEKKISSNTVTFKCAACGRRDTADSAYNLTVSCCSEACFSVAFEKFMKCNHYREYDRLSLLELVQLNPVPMY